MKTKEEIKDRISKLKINKAIIEENGYLLSEAESTDLEFIFNEIAVLRWVLNRDFTKKQIECEENCIKEVIKQYTGKELTLEDAPKVQRAFNINDSSKYILTYDGVQLGMVRYINDGCNFRVEFTPN